MLRNIGALFLILNVPWIVHAKTFKNSYVSFEVPNDWTCVQEGVAWTCTAQNPVRSKEAVIVLAAKVAGPEDNLTNFLTFLRQPKRVPNRVGTPIPSRIMYAQKRMLAKTSWVQAQHLGSEIQDYYTLYLATVKARLAILVSFSSERSRYKIYNPIFDRAMKTLKIVANQELLFPKNAYGSDQTLGIQGPAGDLTSGDGMLPPPAKRKKSRTLWLVLLFGLAAIGAAYYLANHKKVSSSKKRPSRPK